MDNGKQKWLESCRVSIGITNRCNCRCRHCLLKSYTGEMDYEHVLGIIEDLHKNLNMPAVSLTGGEVLYHRRISDILDYCSTSGIGVSFVTNGSLINKSSRIWIENTKPALCLSLDGPKEFHNRFRNNDKSFDGVMNAIDIIQECGVTPSIYFACVKENFQYIDWIIDFCLEKNIRRLRIQPVEYTGQATVNLSKSDLLDSDQKIQFLKKLVDVTGKNIGRLFVNTTSKFRSLIVEHPCIVGGHFGSDCHSNSSPEPGGFDIDPHGQLYPYCKSLNEQYVMGNVFKEKASEMIKNYYLSNKHFTYLNLLKYVHSKRYVNGTTEVVNVETDIYELSNLPFREVNEYVSENFADKFIAP